MTFEYLTLRALSPVQAGHAVRYAGEGYVTPGNSRVLGVAINDAEDGGEVRVLVSGTMLVAHTGKGRPRVAKSGAIGATGKRHDWMSWDGPGVLRLLPPFEGTRGRTVRAILRGDA